MPKQDKKQQIMLAAEKLFTTRRFHEIKLDDVARKARVGKGTIYLYFENKDDLFYQTATSGFEELCQLLQRNIRPKTSFRKEFLTACRQITDFFEKRRQLFRIMNNEDVRLCFARGNIHDRWMQKRKFLLAAVAAIIQRGVEEKEVRDDIPAEVMAGFLLGMLRARAWDIERAAENTRSHAIVVDLFCNGASHKNKNRSTYKYLAKAPA